MIKRNITYLLVLLCVFLLSACKDTSNKNENGEYEVKVFNNDVVSGLDDIDTFYHITNENNFNCYY